MFQTIIDEFLMLFDAASVAKALAGWLPKLAAATFTLLSFWVFWRLARRALRRIEERQILDQTAVAFLTATVKYVVLAAGVLAALGRLGIDTSSVLASLGIAGLTLGFAAKDALSNIISGVFIFWDRPFVIGDLVEVDGRYGRVETITMRSTRIVTVDGRMLAIPNSTVVNGTVVSYTNFPSLRLDIPVSIGVNEDIGRTRAILVEMASAHPAVHPEKKPTVVVTTLGDFNITVELRVWITDERIHIATRNELRERAFEALRQSGVDMPYETLVVHGAPAAA